MEEKIVTKRITLGAVLIVVVFIVLAILALGFVYLSQDSIKPVISVTEEGSGTEDDPYIIRSSKQFIDLQQRSAAGDIAVKGAHFKLENDIYAYKNETESNFEGVLDGNGHTITAVNGYIFEELGENSEIKNVVIESNYRLFNSTSETSRINDCEFILDIDIDEKVTFYGTIIPIRLLNSSILFGECESLIEDCQFFGQASIRIRCNNTNHARIYLLGGTTKNVDVNVDIDFEFVSNDYEEHGRVFEVQVGVFPAADNVDKCNYIGNVNIEVLGLYQLYFNTLGYYAKNSTSNCNAVIRYNGGNKKVIELYSMYNNCEYSDKLTHIDTDGVEEKYTSFYHKFKGSGTAEDPYQIWTWIDFLRMKETCGVSEGVYYKLCNDITEEDVNIIFSSTYSNFEGVLDGNGNFVKIKNQIFDELHGQINNLNIKAVGCRVVNSIVDGGIIQNCSMESDYQVVDAIGPGGVFKNNKIDTKDTLCEWNNGLIIECSMNIDVVENNYARIVASSGKGKVIDCDIVTSICLTIENGYYGQGILTVSEENYMSGVTIEGEIVIKRKENSRDKFVDIILLAESGENSSAAIEMWLDHTQDKYVYDIIEYNNPGYEYNNFVHEVKDWNDYK